MEPGGKARLTGYIGMMRRLIGAMATIWLAVGMPITPLFAQTPPTEQAGRLSVGGESRTYLLYVPSIYRADHPAPLVLVFHGAGASPLRMARHTRFSALAEREGFVVAYPAGIGRRWADGRGFGTPHDDVAFVSALLDTLAHRLAIDPQRIYATGISNGAMFTYRLACELPGIFAAVAPVAGALPAALLPSCEHAEPVSVAAFQGTADRLVPYDGGGVAVRRGQVLSADRSVALWAAIAGCGTAPIVTSEPDRAPSDGMRVRLQAYPACRAGREVELYTIEGGGHTWPGGPPSGRAVGPVTRDLDATSTIWSFFASHPRP